MGNGYTKSGVFDPSLALVTPSGPPKGPVKTFGEVLSDCILEAVAVKPPQSGFQLVCWNEKKFLLERSIKIRSLFDSGAEETIFEAPEVDSTLLRALRFPTEPTEYDSEFDLFSGIYNLIQQYTDLPEKLCRLLAYCALASWFADCAPRPICISIMGPESRQGWQLFRILSCLFRRPLLLSDINLGVLCSLPAGLSPTLFLEQRDLTRQAEKALYVPNARDTFVPWKGRLVNFCWWKVIRTEQPLNNRALGDSVIEVPVDPGCTSFPGFDPWSLEEFTSQFQPKLLMYRLKNRHQIHRYPFGFPGLLPGVEDLATFLARCAAVVPGAREEMASLLEEQNQQAQIETEMDLNAIVLEVLLSFCHQRDKISVRVAEVALGVNALLEQIGEAFELSPKVVGGRLKTLGLYTKRIDAMGRGLTLTDANRNLIHKLAWGCRVERARDSLHCEHCKHFAHLEELSKLPYDPLKTLKLSPKSDGEQMQPAVRPTPVTNREPAASEEHGSPRWVETAEDRRFIDKLKKDLEF